MSPSAMPRTTTVAVWVVPMPPMEATIGMKIARRGQAPDGALEQADDRGGQHGGAEVDQPPDQPLGEDGPGGSRTVSSPGDAAEPLDVLGGLLADDVDDVVHADGAEQAAVAVHHRHLHQVVTLHQPRDLLLVGVDGHALRRPRARTARTGVAGSAVSSRCRGRMPTR